MNLKRFFSSKRVPLENLTPDDIVIVVIGPTGAGKSSFINTAVDRPVLEVNHTLSPRTHDFAHAMSYMCMDSRRVVFVDTPAFPDPMLGSNISAEKRVAKKTSEWIKESFGKHIQVTNILYLYSIAINRLTEPLPHYEIFRKLCGNQFPESVALVLTMCENVEPAICQDRREHLTKRWKRMMGENAVVHSHYGTTESAWDVVTALNARWRA